MFFHGLKINIAVQLAILIAMGMILIHMAMITVFQEMLTHSLVSKADLLAELIISQLPDAPNKKNAPVSLKTLDRIREVMAESDVECASIIADDGRPLFSLRPDCDAQGLLKRLVPLSMAENKRQVRFSGETWGVFWKQEEYLAIAWPLVNENRTIGGTGMVLQLKGIYKALRKVQGLFWSYFSINLILLTLAGLYQISKITVKPLNRLLDRAGQFREEGDMAFAHEEDKNEFGKLSAALNRIFMGISRDKAALKQTVQSLENLNLELKQTQKDMVRAEKLASVGRLSSGIAHEIGNPIGIVLGYLNLLKEENLPYGERMDFIARAQTEIHRINTVVRQLLDFAKPATDEIKPVPVNEILSGLADVITPQPFMARIRLSLKLSAVNDIVAGNPDSIRQVFFNLLINAADAISSREDHFNGSIDVSTENINILDSESGKTLPSLKITVRDNGCGITDENLANIFDPFFTTKDPGKGTGLGLSVSFMIVENMGGKMEAENNADKGASLYVLLPLHTDFNPKT